MSPNDGFPAYICALCISYLKHAVNFREQCLKNAFYFKIVETFHHRDATDIDLKKFNNKKSKTKNETNTEVMDKVSDSKANLSKLANKCDKHGKGSSIMSTQREIDALKLLDNATKAEYDEANKQLLANFNSTLAHISAELDWSPDKIESTNIIKEPSGTSCIGSIKSTAKAKAHTEDDGFQTGTSSDGIEEVLVAGNVDSSNIRNLDSMLNDPNVYNKRLCGEQNDDEDTVRNTTVNYSNYSPLKKIEGNPSTSSPKRAAVNGIVEHKCPVCFFRFMTPQTFNYHLKTCIEYKLVSFTEEAERLGVIRRQSITPHEYIRRMISCIYKMCQWIQVNYVDLFENILLIPNGPRIGQKLHVNLDYHQDDIAMDYSTPVLYKKCCNDDTIYRKIADLDLIDQRAPHQLIKKSIINMENNVLYAIEKSIAKSSVKQKMCQTRNSTINDDVDLTIESDPGFRMPLIKNPSTPISAKSGRNGKPEWKLTYQNKNNRSQITSSSSMPNSPLTNNSLKKVSQNNKNNSFAPTFSARCSACNLVFQSLAGFEKHNEKYHNTFAISRAFSGHQWKKNQQQN